jgi:DNA repair exonuclease SbcCD ATPase subunit
MKTIKLKKLSLINFKGVKALEIDFKDETNIEGKNGSGKTTVFDAYSWLLFGKNSQNQSDFSIKTNDANNNVIHNLEHSVEGTLQVDDSILVLKRVLREKWTKKRGSEVSELTGNETIFFINEVPKSLSEYKLIVDGIISEESQKVLSNPLYFNQTMKWQDRRNILSKLAGDITNDLILEKIKGSYRTELEKMLSTDKTLEDYKREFSAKRKKIKDELDLIPSRIDEASRSKPEDKNWNQIESSIKSKNLEISSIDLQIEDITKQQEAHFDKISEAKNLKFQKEQELVSSINDSSVQTRRELNNIDKLKSEIKHIIDINEVTITNIKQANNDFQKDIDKFNKLNDSLREAFQVQNSSEIKFDDTLAKCSTCFREYEKDKIDEIKNNSLNELKRVKNQLLIDIRTQGTENKKKIEELELNIAKNNSEIENLKLIIEDKTQTLKEVSENEQKLRLIVSEKTELTTEQQKIQAEIDSIVIPDFNAPDNSFLKATKTELQLVIDGLKAELHDKNQIEKINERISELEIQQRKLAQEIASFEKQEIAIENYNSEKNNLIERSVNDKFSLVKFKLFEAQMNGGINEICEATVNGVLFNDLNTATKINSGLDVINVLSNYYDVTAPVFLDNRESTTNIISSNSQIISLFVNPKCETLKIN